MSPTRSAGGDCRRCLLSLALSLPMIAAGIDAHAADLGPTRRPYPTFEAYPYDSGPASWPGIWQGFYAGIDGGYGWGSLDPTDRGDGVALDGGTLGGHVGYNWQATRLVLGLEGDIGRHWGQGSRHYADPAWLDGEASLLASLRLRAGIAFDNALIYATGGVAVGRFDADLTTAAGAFSASETVAGYAVGGGIEMKITSSISGRVEALYYGFDGASFDFASGALGADLSTTTVRAGISYHFN